MKIKVNGKETETTENISVTELLETEKVKMPDMVSVELNGDILERKALKTTLLKNGDEIEFLYYMGGG